nr:MAG TPA: hypothetical protein [Caudoviricetes sp.]
MYIFKKHSPKRGNRTLANLRLLRAAYYGVSSHTFFNTVE